MFFIISLLRRVLLLALLGGLSATIAKPIFELSEPSSIVLEDYIFNIVNVSADGTLATISDSYVFGGPPHIIDIASGKEIDTTDFPMAFFSYKFAPVYLSDNGEFIAGSGYVDSGQDNYQDNYIYNLKNKTVEKIISEDFTPGGISPDGSVVVGRYDVSVPGEHVYRISAYYSKHQMKKIDRFDSDSWEEAIDIAGDNDTLVVNSYNPRPNPSHKSFVYHIESKEKTRIAPVSPYDFIFARAISGDASTIVGYMEKADEIKHAFYYDVKSEKTTDLSKKMTNLGNIERLKNSYARGVSKNGNVIVGYATDGDEDDEHSTAFYYDRKNADDMTDLGALPAIKENYTNTKAYAVNGDGSVVIGEGTVVEDINNDADIENEDSEASNNHHLLVWRVRNPESTPVDVTSTRKTSVKPDIIPVDATSTRKTFVKMAEKDHDLHALTRGQLDGLATMHCALEDKTYCLGAFATANHASHDGGHLLNSGIHGALRLAPQWSTGLSLSYLANDSLPGGIKSRGRHTPGVGAYLRYTENRDRSGLSVTASAAWQKQKLAIRRTTIGQTEPGGGDSTIEGTLLALDGAYGVRLAAGTLLSPTLGLHYLNTRRDGYRETREAALPATYGKSGETNTALRVGVGFDHALSRQWSLHADAGTRIVLGRDRDPFTVHADYIGGGTYDLSRSGEKRRFLPYANAGLSVRWGGDDASLARLHVGMAKSDYGNNDAHIGLSYAYRF